MGALAGKRVLITGVGGGIGAAIMRRFAAEGAQISGTDRAAIAAPEMAAFREGDLADPAFADSLPAWAAETLGGLDILVNNAGIIHRGAITETDDAAWAASIAINLEAPFRTCRAAVPLMAAAGSGAIVNIASCWGLRPGPGHAVYCMTKAALAALTQCMGMDHARDGVRVNAVCPNEVNTPMLRTGFERRGLDPASAVAALGATVPLGRVAEPDDIADVALFLASDASRYVCGALIEANGGKPVG